MELPTYERKVDDLQEKQGEISDHPHTSEDDKRKVDHGMDDLKPRWDNFKETLFAKRDR